MLAVCYGPSKKTWVLPFTSAGGNLPQRKGSQRAKLNQTRSVHSHRKERDKPSPDSSANENLPPRRAHQLEHLSKKSSQTNHAYATNHLPKKEQGPPSQPMGFDHHTEPINDTPKRLARRKSERFSHLAKGAPADRADDLVPFRFFQGVRFGEGLHDPFSGLRAQQRTSPENRFRATLLQVGLRACLNSLQRACERAEQSEAARGHSFRACAKKRVWVHAGSWASPTESVRTVSFAHATGNWCPHPSSVVPIYIK